MGEILNLKELEFSPDGHVYRLNGMVIPSVSKVMEPVSMSEYGVIDPMVLSRAADRGTAVHKAIENYNKYGIMDIDPMLSGYTDAYISWSEKTCPDIIANEMKFYHKLMRYAGTADLIARINGEMWLIDFKTSYKAVDKNYRVQLEAYRQGLSTHSLEIDRKAVLHLAKDGSYTLIEYPLKDSEAWTIFGACKSIYDYNNKF